MIKWKISKIDGRLNRKKHHVVSKSFDRFQLNEPIHVPIRMKLIRHRSNKYRVNKETEESIYLKIN